MIAAKPVVVVPIRTRTADGLERLWRGVQALGSDDPTLHAYTDRDGQVYLAGRGELQLQIIVDRLRRECGVDAVSGPIAVAYRETITADADGEGKFVSHADGRGQYAYVKIHLSPGRPGTGYAFVNVERPLPDAISRAIDQGIRDATIEGSLAGYPVDELCVELRDASFHEASASEEAFRMAGAMACREALRKAQPVLLEPVMRVEVNVPEEMAGAVLEDLARRHAERQSEDVRGSTLVIMVLVRMSEMLGYATALRQMTNGRGGHSMRLDGYARVKR